MKNIIEDIFYDSPEVFSVSDTVLRSVKQFLDSFQTVLGTLKKLSDISNSSRNFETVLGSFKKFSKVSKNSSQKSQTASGTFHKVSGVWKIIGIFKNFSVLSESVCTAITRCVG